jgi:hypothetical protein
MFQHQQIRRRKASRTRLAVLAAAVATGAGLPAVGLLAVPANAGPPPICTGFPAVTCTFAASVSATTWAVPAGVTSVTVTADGASGADAATSYIPAGRGGAGGDYKATLTHIPSGTSLSIFPGAAASGATGGANANGRAGGNSSRDTHSNTGGGGGGATTVSVAPFSVSNLLVVAGGGGGAGAENLAALTPANGGTGGGSSTPNGTNGRGALGSLSVGRGGTTTGPGAGGTSPAGNCTTAAAAGGTLTGGAGLSRGTLCQYAGGGGGSGYNGGGGSGQYAGGGGGSAFPATTSTTDGILVTPRPDTSTNTGAGAVTITYNITARDTQLRVRSSKSGNVITLYADLTGDYSFPIAGAPITFRVLGETVCSDVATNSSGVASCSLTSRQVLLLQISGGYFSASFAGATGVPAASATGAVPQYYIY